jgi:hypothetical protein
MAKKTGKAGNITLNSTVVAIHKWEATPSREMQRMTDSADYNSTKTQLYRSSLPGELSLSGSIAFNFDTNTTEAQILDKFESDTPVPLVLKYDANTIAFSCNAWLETAPITCDVNGKIEGTATFISDGPIQIGAS